MAEISTIEHREFVEFLVVGRVSADEIIQHFDLYYRSGASRLILWDFGQGSLADISAARFQDIAAVSRGYRELRGAAPRSALVAASKPEFLLIQSFIAWSEAINPFTRKGFMDREVAIRWLLSDEA